MMAYFWVGEGGSVGIQMRNMLCAFPLFPQFASLLIPWQTLMRLQLPGSANSTSIIHPVQLHPLNTPHTHTHTQMCSSDTNIYALYLLPTHIYTPFPFSPSTMAWLLAVTVIKARHCLFMADPKYELKLSRKEVAPEAFSKGCCITQEQTQCLVWKEGDKCCLGLSVGTKCLCVYTWIAYSV